MEGDHNPIPYARFAEVIEERKALQMKLEAQSGELQKMKESRDRLESKFEAQIAERDKTISQMGIDHQVEVSLASTGIDDADVIDLLKRKHAASGEDGERADFSDWFGEYRDSKPAILRPFEKVEEKSASSNPSAPQRRAPPKGNPSADPTINGRETNTPPTTTNITPQSLASMSKAEIDAHGGMDAILAGVLGAGRPFDS